MPRPVAGIAASIAVCLALLALTFVPSAAVAASDLVIKESKLSVKDTIDALVKALEAKGIKFAARVDHAAGAKAVSMELAPSEVLLFGNPMLGTPLMQSNPEIGLDLPMKVLAYTDKGGKVMVAYINPDALKARYGITDRDPQFKAMAGALEAFTAAAISGK